MQLSDRSFQNIVSYNSEMSIDGLRDSKFVKGSVGLEATSIVCNQSSTNVVVVVCVTLSFLPFFSREKNKKSKDKIGWLIFPDPDSCHDFIHKVDC